MDLSIIPTEIGLLTNLVDLSIASETNDGMVEPACASHEWKRLAAPDVVMLKTGVRE